MTWGIESRLTNANEDSFCGLCNVNEGLIYQENAKWKTSCDFLTKNRIFLSFFRKCLEII